jgi:hypothetical protein
MMQMNFEYERQTLGFDAQTTNHIHKQSVNLKMQSWLNGDSESEYLERFAGITEEVEVKFKVTLTTNDSVTRLSETITGTSILLEATDDLSNVLYVYNQEKKALIFDSIVYKKNDSETLTLHRGVAEKEMLNAVEGGRSYSNKI